MKTRTGFVSNSSSSSFVIGIKDPSSSIGRFLQAFVDVNKQYKGYGASRGKSVIDDFDGYFDEGDQKLVKMASYDQNLVSISVGYGDENLPDILDKAEKQGHIEIFINGE